MRERYIGRGNRGRDIRKVHRRDRGGGGDQRQRRREKEKGL